MISPTTVIKHNCMGVSTLFFDTGTSLPSTVVLSPVGSAGLEVTRIAIKIRARGRSRSPVRARARVCACAPVSTGACSVHMLNQKLIEGREAIQELKHLPRDGLPLPNWLLGNANYLGWRLPCKCYCLWPPICRLKSLY